VLEISIKLRTGKSIQNGLNNTSILGIEETVRGLFQNELYNKSHRKKDLSRGSKTLLKKAFSFCRLRGGGGRGKIKEDASLGTFDDIGRIV